MPVVQKLVPEYKYYKDLRNGAIVGPKKNMFQEEKDGSWTLRPEFVPWGDTVPETGPDGVVRDPQYYNKVTGEAKSPAKNVKEGNKIEMVDPSFTDDERIEAIVEACSKVESADMTTAGLPKTYPLQRLSGQSDITNEEKELAWNIYKTRMKAMGVD